MKLRFGAYHSTEGPGLAYAIPYVDEIRIVPTQRLLKLEFGFTTPQAQPTVFKAISNRKTRKR